MKKTVFIVGGGWGGYHKMFLELGFDITENIKEASVVCFTGGADVTPHLYGADKHPFTGNDYARDMRERTAFMEAQESNIPMVGICRGGQFLNVMSGGEMYQHVSRHTEPHYLVDNITGETVYVSSTHHQMMKPSNDAIIIATSNQRGSREWYEGSVFKRDISDEDIEIVFYEKTKCLCFQPHPEFNDVEFVAMRTYFQSLLARYLGV